MRITELTIDHFRSINKCHVRFNEINAVIGENNAGKTALLRALNSVFNWEFEKKYFFDNTHQYTPRTATKISIVFDDLPNKEIYQDKRSGDNLILNFSYYYGTRKRTLSCQTAQAIINVDDEFLNGLKKDIDYVYIPASRGNRDLMWTDNTIFKRILTAYSQHYTQSRDNISRHVERVAEILKQTIFSKLENEVGRTSMLEPSEQYSFKYKEAIDYTVFLDKVGMNILSDGKDFPVAEYGSGIKSLTVIALYRALAKIENANVILGIEEPETNLHPHAQKKLIASIKNNRQDSEIQAILATHSTVIVDELSHEDIILARRVHDEKRGFFTEFTQLETEFWDKYNLDEYKHNNFFRYKNSEFFFSRYVIIVESITDAQVITRLIEDNIGDKKYYVSILNLDGVKNLKYPYFLLKSLGIPFSMVVDRDFLTPYINDKLDASRNPVTFLPEYRNQANRHSPIINSIWNSETELQKLTRNLQGSYLKLFNFCRPHKLYPMQYCLEMDLVASSESRLEYYRVMNIPENCRTQKELLIQKKDAIKAPDKVMSVLVALTPVKYPYSFKKIRTALIEDINLAF